MGDSLEDRLKDHAKAFDGLLSLIPAKYYYGEDNSDQWQRKKQTKEEARRAKIAKLDPESVKSAKDVLDERIRKRKREEEGSDIEGIETEQPKQGLRAHDLKSNKKVRKNGEKHSKVSAETLTEEKADKATDTNLTSQKKSTAEKRRDKRERVKAAQIALEEKRKRKKARKQSAKADLIKETRMTEGQQEVSGKATDDGIETKKKDLQGQRQSKVVKAELPKALDRVDASLKKGEGKPEDEDGLDEIGAIEFHAESVELPFRSESTSSPPSAPASPVFDIPVSQSGTSSTSSIIPPTTVRKIPKTAADSEELRARLAARIEALRALRKADGPDGAPARNRQELLEARRKKEEERKAKKKELRLKAKDEEKLARLHGTSSKVVTEATVSRPAARSELQTNFSFGTVAFSDGQRMDAGLNTLLDSRKKKGPQDPLGAMRAAENKRLRLSGFDEEKRKDIEEKDMWLNASKRAHGERIRDDASLLKKTLKRQEKAKKKSETEWRERLAGVEKGKEMKQKKREENLRKRREEKGGKGKKKTKAPSKKKNRPGFEGSFRAKPASKK